MSQTNYTPIQLYRTTTASLSPSAGNLADGELGINLTDEKLYFKNAGGTVKLLAANLMPVANGGTGVTTSTGSGSVVLSTSPTLVTPTLSGVTLSDGTANGVLYLNGSKQVTSGSGLTFNGAKLTVSGTTNEATTITSNATTTALVLDNTHANGWGSNLAIKTGGVTAGFFGTVGSLLGSTSQNLAIYAAAGNGVCFYTNGSTERMRLDSSGNLVS